MAGALGMDWRPFSWNELHHMYMGFQRTEWERTSSILTMLINVNTEKDKQIKDLDTFNAFRLDNQEEDIEELLRRAEVGEVKSNFSIKDLNLKDFS